MNNQYASYAMSRRAVILGATGASLAACATAPRGDTELASIESRLEGRVGVAAFDVSTGRTISHRADERFAMCSTFKWALAALLLREQEAGRLSIHRPLPIREDDLVPYAPVVEKRVASGSMTIAELCAAATGLSDNAAANILLRLIGGPEGFTASLRALGDQTTRLDRWETDLNENAPGDPRDTTTPSAMIALLRTFFIGDALNAASKERLAAWMIASKTGADRLRAGLPQGWTVGDKTGTSGNGAYNDVAFAVPDGRAPIFIACYVNAPSASGADANAAHAAVARRIAAEFA
ncbi:MAG: class A beta-lactamase [Parvularculaceae bacterium]